MGERENVVVKPGKKRKAIQDNTDFEAIIKQRHEKKEKLDSKQKAEKSEMARVKSIFGIKPNLKAVREYLNSQDDSD